MNVAGPAGMAWFAVLALALLGGRSSAEARGKGGRRTTWTEDAAAKRNQTARMKGRGGRLFSMFNVVTFQNGPCASTQSLNGANRNGTCFSSTECTDKSGTVAGNCAAGFGVCCVFVLQTGSTSIGENCTYIQNMGYPSALEGTAPVSYTVNKLSNDVCMLRLDFERFTIAGTGGSANDNEGDCLDTFTVTVQSGQIPPMICGENTGQHKNYTVYVDIGANAGDTATLAFAFSSAVTTASRMFDIKVTQIECNNPNRPRDTCCLQYHTGCTGRIQTFNYDPAGSDNHLNNQEYSICIRQEEGYCCVEYQVCPDGNTPDGLQKGWSFDARNKLSSADSACLTDTNTIDHISIPQSGAGCSPMGGNVCRAIHSRYCGGNLHFNEDAKTSIPICDCTAPFTVDIHFNDVDDFGLPAMLPATGILPATKDDGNTPAKQSLGLCLEYQQIPC